MSGKPDAFDALTSGGDLAALVRPLVWEWDDFAKFFHANNELTACNWTIWQERDRFVLAATGQPLRTFHNPDEAKAAAQAYYTARILAALDLDALARIVEAARVEALGEAEWQQKKDAGEWYERAATRRGKRAKELALARAAGHLSAAQAIAAIRAGRKGD